MALHTRKGQAKLDRDTSGFKPTFRTSVRRFGFSVKGPVRLGVAVELIGVRGIYADRSEGYMLIGVRGIR